MTATLDDATDTVRPKNVQGSGGNTVTRRALDRLVAAVTADTFGVTARAVQVDLSDHNGLLALKVRTPIRVLTLERIQRTPTVVETGRALIQQAAAAQTTIRQRVTELSGAEIAHVTVELTGIDIREERRVR
jgi:uncharacterized alkaline shock family protein YloU